MSLEVLRVPLAEVLPLRNLYREEMHCQIVHDSYHDRGFTDSYLLKSGGRIAGYGSVAGLPGNPKDVIKEFYLLPEHRGGALRLFRALLEHSRARMIEAQTNDELLLLMLLDCSETIEREKVLFADAFTSRLTVAGARYRATTESDKPRMFEHTSEPAGDRVIEVEGRIVATGGLMFHYNPPYGDLYMEVAPDARRRGYGSYLVQELKRECYELGRIPAARCRADNNASRATLEKAGMRPCARILIGTVNYESENRT